MKNNFANIVRFGGIDSNNYYQQNSLYSSLVAKVGDKWRVLLPKADLKGSDYRFYNFYGFFNALGYTKSGNGFRVNGCGMDMVFNTNYVIIHKLHHLGFITKKECDILAQKTPSRF